MNEPVTGLKEAETGGIPPRIITVPPEVVDAIAGFLQGKDGYGQVIITFKDGGISGVKAIHEKKFK